MHPELAREMIRQRAGEMRDQAAKAGEAREARAARDAARDRRDRAATMAAIPMPRIRTTWTARSARPGTPRMPGNRPALPPLPELPGMSYLFGMLGSDVSRRGTSPVLIGRATQLAALAEALETVRQGSPAALLIGGEAGVGKSRLIAEFAASARESGARVLTGECLELGRTGCRSARSPRCSATWCGNSGQARLPGCCPAVTGPHGSWPGCYLSCPALRVPRRPRASRAPGSSRSS